MVKRSEEKTKRWFAQVGPVPSSGVQEVCQFVSEHGWDIIGIVARGVQSANAGSVISSPQVPKVIDVCGVVISKEGTESTPPELPEKQFRFQV